MPDSIQSTSSLTPTSSSPQQIRLLVLDLDGTIVGLSNQIQPAVKQSIQAAQAKGVQVAIATGRMFCSAVRFHQEIGSTLPLLSYQGALIKHPATQQIYRHWTVPRTAALHLVDHFQQPKLREQLSVHLYVNDRLYVRELTSESIAYSQRSNVELHPVGDLSEFIRQADEPTKVLALSDEPQIIDDLLTNLRQQYTPAELYFTKSIATFFEATHPAVNKGTAVKYLAEELLQLQPENVMTIGDNFNDLEMIQYAGIGVAMADAPEAVKASADWVTPSVEAEGITAAVEQFILSN